MWARLRWAAIALLLAVPAAALSPPPEQPAGGRPAGRDYARWLQDVALIISPVERRVFDGLRSDGDRELFIELFWKHRDPTPGTADNEFRDEHYRRLDYVLRRFTTLTEPGWATPAGRLYVVSGQTKIDLAEVVLRLRVLEGRREGAAGREQPVTSSFLRFMQAETIETDPSIEEEAGQIRRVFNLRDVTLLTETQIVWEAKEASRAFHFFRLGDRDYAILVTPKDLQQRTLTLRVEVLEQGPKIKADLLDTEVSLPGRNLAVFGFEDTAGKPYFVSLRLAGLVGGQTIAAEAGKPYSPTRRTEKTGESGVAVIQVKEKAVAPKEQTKGRKPPVGAIGLSKEKWPQLLKSVEPVYPAEARQAGVEGIVIVEATTDEKGNVADAKVLRSIPLLDQAAIDAVKQWKYEPFIFEGEPRGLVFTVTVRFELDAMVKKEERAKQAAASEAFARGAVKVVGEIKPPRLLRSVEPVYPEEARQAKVEGVVILAVRTDKKGNVENLQVLRSVPLLDQAAIDAIRQWRYEPLIVKGEAKPAVFTATVRFQLK